ncbi:dimethylarginine dimethylaminohydrolase family protein [Brevibacillus agri]|uniref:dimethylarginine dimethylaminohydrolase family protein n=1 Tax=Brevibacillus agri TaxID=51101 RepID=UPI003D21FDE9
MSIAKLLMCPPTFYDIKYSINYWTNVEDIVDKEKAFRQWQKVHDTLVGLGIHVELLEPVEGLPDMTTVGDAGMVYNGKFLAANFRHKERQGEVVHYINWMKKYGMEIHEVPEDVFFEGLGDIIQYGKNIIFGYGARSSKEAIESVKEVFPELDILGEYRIKDNSFFHASHAIALIEEKTILYYPEAFEEESLQQIENLFESRIAVSEEDANNFICNCIPVGNKVLVDSCSIELENELNRFGYEVLRCDVSEFKKTGASLRCLILTL